MKKLLPPTLFYFCVFLIISLNWLLPIYNLISYPYSLAGLVPLIAGIIISVRGSNQFQKIGTNIKTFDEPDKLVTDGLFKYSRNPMYLGFVLALSGISILAGTVSSFIILVAFIIITDRWYIAFEEKMMGEKFGARYEEYRTETRRWL